MKTTKTKKATPEYRFCLKSRSGKLFCDTMDRTKLDSWKRDGLNIVGSCLNNGWFMKNLNKTPYNQMRAAKKEGWEIVMVKIAETNET